MAVAEIYVFFPLLSISIERDHGFWGVVALSQPAVSQYFIYSYRGNVYRDWGKFKRNVRNGKQNWCQQQCWWCWDRLTMTFKCSAAHRLVLRATTILAFSIRILFSFPLSHLCSKYVSICYKIHDTSNILSFHFSWGHSLCH